MKFGFIYITTNNINGKKYIGKRHYTGGWKKYLGSGTYLKNAIGKYGKDNFSREIIEECSNEESLCEREKYWIDKYNAVESNAYYNIAKGGLGGSPETTKIMCLNTLTMYTSVTDASNKIGISMASLSNCYNGKSVCCYKNKKPMVFVTYEDYMVLSDYEIECMLKNAGTLHERNKGKLNPRSKSVVCLDDESYFDTVLEASIYYECEKNRISMQCKGKFNHVYSRRLKKDIRFCYKEDYENGDYVKDDLLIANRHNKPIICITTGEIFESIKIASIKTGALEGNISLNARGLISYCGTTDDGRKMMWMYYEEYDKNPVTDECINKKFVCVNTGEEFYSTTDACNRYGIKSNKIVAVLNGERGSCGKLNNEKLKWRYI